MSPFESLRSSVLAIRWSLAAVFIWSGVDKFISPEYWLNAWHSKILNSITHFAGLETGDFIAVIALIEVLIGISLITNLFIKEFSLVGLFMICSGFIFFGFSEIMIRSIGLAGGFVALLFWPSRHSI